MKFEVVNKNGQVIMWTDSIDCIPALSELKAICSAGYCCKVNNKVSAYDKVHELIGGTMLVKSDKTKPKRLF
ncbi:MAG: hypothetical protein NC320_03165 [Clostridium sp.]|nr:hypothetical protein [Clostridium sp.]